MESINVIIDDEVEAPSKGEENQLISVELPISSANVIKTSPAESLQQDTLEMLILGRAPREDAFMWEIIL
jgi:ribosomal protein L24